MRPAAKIQLSNKDRTMLEGLIQSGTCEQRIVFRVRIILLAGEGLQTTLIAEQLKTRPTTVSKWRNRFASDGLAGLQDSPRPGQTKKYDDTTEKRILDVLNEAPPKGYAQWNGQLIADHLDIPAHYVWSVFRANGIHLQRRRSWCISTDPEFAEKAADVVGIYLNPPENAVVLCMDEKPCIQALERAQGYLVFPDGKTVSGFSHEYKRHGTSTLFAALEVATGMIKADHYSRRRRREFIDFMNGIVKSYGKEREIHVILDNLNTHKPKTDRWLSRHKNVHLHYIPKHSSWMNMIEIWFSMLSRHALRGANFTSVKQLRKAIDDYIEVHNQKAAPFEWRKEKVYPKSLKVISLNKLT